MGRPTKEIVGSILGKQQDDIDEEA